MLRLLTLVLCVATALKSSPLVLTFEGLLDGEEVLGYYGGGAGGSGSTSSLLSFLSFGPGSVATVDKDAGGTGNFAKAPSGVTVLQFLEGSPASLTAAPNLSLSSVGLYYTPPGSPLLIQLFAGPGGTGSLIGLLQLSGSRATCGVDPVPEFSCWVWFNQQLPAGVRSLVFVDWSARAFVDNLEIGMTISVPEPGNLLSLAVALLGMWATTFHAKRGKNQAEQQRDGGGRLWNGNISAQLPSSQRTGVSVRQV